ncbi:MAG: TonB-dependent receptor [Calditrichaeota bacterium]|nr:TonB-dependent receptor [Calditrichota bacterium]
MMRQNSHNIRRWLGWVMSMGLLITTVYAGNTGKIAGRVYDRQTGEPLVGVNILIKNTYLGAATDEDGFFYILQVPPGIYEVEAEYIGYRKVVIRNVRVRVDLTTELKIAMEPETIQGPVVEVVAEEPMVQPDITSTRRITSEEEIIETPGFETTTDIFMLQGGAVVDVGPQSIPLGDGIQLQVRDESLKNIHIRGGRGGEILYMVDGVPVTHPIYGGRDVLDLNVVDVQAMELLTGAFNAEYGQAQSGVVNITTRSGSDRFEGGIEFKASDQNLLFQSFSSRYLSFYLGGPEPLTRKLLPSLGIRLPGRFYYFISGNANLDNTAYNNHRKRGTIQFLGMTIREKQQNTGNLNAKLNWKLSNTFEIVLSYHGSWRSWSNFNWLWKNYPDHMAAYRRSNQNVNIRFNHTLSQSTFYNINIGYLGVDYDGSLDGRRPPDYWRFFKDSVEYDYWTYRERFGDAPPDSVKSTILPPQFDPYGFFDNRGYENIWRDDETHTFILKGDLTSQIHPEHLMKTGIEIRYNDIRYVDIQDGGVLLSRYGQHLYKNEPYFPPPIGPFKEFGQNRWVFNAYPVIGGAYIQDKFEKETMIINAGVRVDWFQVGSTVMHPEWKKTWEAATGLKADWKWIKYKISPRFGISFPISEKTVVFFSYGHFNQLPELQFFYRDPYTGGFTGNPHLDFEQTILYEFGFTHQLARNWALDIKSYTKDISKQVGTTRLRAALGLPVDLYDNNGYARARGLEFELTKRYSNFLQGRLTYTVQWANGYSSSAFEDYIRSINDFPNPIRERRLSWDIRHQFILQAMIVSPPKKHLRFFGLKLPDDWNITILSRYASGQPYTPFTLDPVEAQKKENSATAPPTYTTDVKIKKTFRINGVKLALFVDIFNVFDTRNVQVSYGFNTYTGKPYRYGDIDPQLVGNNIYRYFSWYEILPKMDPRRFAPGRYAKLGMRIDW